MSVDEWDWKTTAPEFHGKSGGVLGGLAQHNGGGEQAQPPAGETKGAPFNSKGSNGPQPTGPGVLAPQPAGLGVLPPKPTGLGVLPAACAAPGGPVLGGGIWQPGPMQGLRAPGPCPRQPCPAQPCPGPCLADFAGGGVFPGQMFVAQVPNTSMGPPGPAIMGMAGSGYMPQQTPPMAMQGVEFAGAGWMPAQQPAFWQEVPASTSSWQKESPPPEDAHGERIRLAQMQARYDKQMKAKEEELRQVKEQLEREERDKVMMQAEFEWDRQGWLYNMSQVSQAAGDRETRQAKQAWVEEKNWARRNQAESRKEQSSNVSHNRGAASREMQSGSGMASEAFARRSTNGNGMQSAPTNRQGYPEGARSSASSKPKEVLSLPGLGVEASRHLFWLEQQAGSVADARARKMVEALGPDLARQALQHAEELLQAPGSSRPAKLSSLLQSACRKIKRNAAPAKDAAQHRSHDAQISGTSASAAMASSTSGANLLERRLAVTRAPATGTQWSTSRFERFARQTPGAFDLRRQGGPDATSWTLKLRMNELSPPLNDEGMQVYCRWLHQGLQRAREEFSIRSLRSVRAEVSFAWNGMGDEAVGRLLHALQRSELRVANLNFSGNCLGPTGASHVCDFVQEANFTLFEVNLSHNNLDELVTIDIVRLFAEHSKYPARRSGNAKAADNVRLCLGHNGLQSTSKLLRKLEAIPGVSLQLSSHRRDAREWMVLKQGSPLLCLPGFEAQEPIRDCTYAPDAEALSKPSGGSQPGPRGILGGSSFAQSTHKLSEPASKPVPEQTPEPDDHSSASSVNALKQGKKEETDSPREWKAAEQRRRQRWKDRKDQQNRWAPMENRLPLMEEGDEEEDDEEEEVIMVGGIASAQSPAEDPAPPSPTVEPAVRLTAPPKILLRRPPPAEDKIASESNVAAAPESS